MSGNTTTDIWVAGAFAAFTVDLLVYPLDTLKTRIQSPDYKKLFLNHGTDTVKKAALFRGLYQGVGSVILATLPSSGAFFSTYEGVKAFGDYHNNGLLPTPIIHSLASGSAELVSCAILTPAEVIKQNAQMVSQKSAAETNATVSTLRKFRSNPLALWRGYGALAGRNLPFTALQFPLFERFKVAVKDWRERKVGKDRRRPEEVPLWEHGLITASAAGTAGAISAVVTTPVDVVKTRIMLAAATTFADQDVKELGKEAAAKVKEGKVADAVGAITGGSEPKKKPQSSWAIGREIVQSQGWKGLMRGGALRGGWTMLGSGLYLGVYESGRLYLERGRMHDDDA